MPTYRSVIVGLTGIGANRPEEPKHLPIFEAKPKSHAGAYHRHPQTDLVAVCDIRQEQMDVFKERWEDVWPDMHYYTDFKEMLAKEQPDLVSVATPDHFHADITVDAAEGGAKAVLCEKPLATTLADADRMIAAAKANNVLLSVEHTRRWGATYHAVRELIRSGELGPLRGIVSPVAFVFGKVVKSLFQFGENPLRIGFGEEADKIHGVGAVAEKHRSLTEKVGRDPA